MKESMGPRSVHDRRQDTLIPPTPVPIPAPTPPNNTQSTSGTISSFSLSGVTGSETSSASITSSSPATFSTTSAATPSSSSTTLNGISGIPTFKFIYLVPVIAVAGVILIVAVIWLTQGCVTRKPKTIEDDPEAILGGPRYEFIAPGKQPFQDGHAPVKNDDVDDLYSGYGTRLGYEHIGAGNYNHTESPYAFADEAHTEAPVDHLRPLAYNPRRPRYSHLANGNAATGYSPPISDTTSVALLDLYESDDEKDDVRRQQEPWETLRHRSIKRGILEIVQKEKGWMDSVRAVAGSSFVNQGKKHSSYASAGGDAQDPHVVPNTRRRESEAWFDGGRRRAKSSVRLPSPTLTTGNPTSRSKSTREPVSEDAYRNLGTPWSEETGFKIIQESPIASPPLLQGQGPRQRQRRDNGGGAGAERSHPAAATTLQDYFNYKLPPVGANSVPMDHSIGIGHRDTRISMLPLSPPRIMSPPLENQLTFTPMPAAEQYRPIPASPFRRGRDNNHTLLTRLEDRKGKREQASSSSLPVDVDRPLPYPEAREGVVAPLRPEKRHAKLVKVRPDRSGGAGGRYQPISGGMGGAFDR